MHSTALEKVLWFYDKDLDEIHIELEDKTDRILSALVLRGCRLQDKHDWKKLKPKMKQITTLKFDYTDLEGKVQGLANFVQRYHVQSLSLINTCLQTGDLKQFYEELLKECKTGKVRLRAVNFKFLELEPSGCEIIAKIMNLLSDVEELVLTNSDLHGEAIEKFLSTVDDGKVIKKLLLSENDGFTAEGMLNIGRLAKKCLVQEIGLESCYLTDDHIETLLTSLSENVQSISLSDNPQLSAESFDRLLTKCKALRKIDLSGHSLDNEQSSKLLQKFSDREIIGFEKTPDTQHTGDSSELINREAPFTEGQNVSDDHKPLPWIKTPPESSAESSKFSYRTSLLSLISKLYSCCRNVLFIISKAVLV